MAEYLIRYKDAQSQADALQGIGKTLATFESRLNAIANAMDTRDDSLASLKAQVKACGKAVPVTANKCSQASSALMEISSVYLGAEHGAYGNIMNIKSNVPDIEKEAIATILANSADLSSTDRELLDILVKDPTKTAIDIIKALYKAQTGESSGILGFIGDLYGTIKNFNNEKYYHGILDILKIGGNIIVDSKLITGAQTVLGLKGSQAVGAVLDFFKNTYDNFYTEGNSTGRAWAETIGEGVALAGVTYFGAAASSVILPMVGVGVATVGAPAIAFVAATAVTSYAIKKGLDWFTEGITGGEYDSAVEFMSDTVLDAGKALYDGAVGAAKSVTSAIGSAANWLFGKRTATT